MTVLEEGFDYRGTRYRSLSQIARAITGARWSGPLFFGLRNGSASPKETAAGSPFSDWTFRPKEALLCADGPSGPACPGR